MVPAFATALVFSHSKDPLIFFIFPALLLVVFRLGFPGTVLAVFVIALISIWFTVTGHGPLMLITGTNLLHKIVIEQIFLAVALFTFFPGCSSAGGAQVAGDLAAEERAAVSGAGQCRCTDRPGEQAGV